MRWTTAILMGLAACAAWVVAAPSDAQLRTAPDIQTPEDYQPGTGVNRLGIRSQSSGARSRSTNTVVLPGGGYYYGWSPGGYYYGDSYYYDNYLRCRRCGRRWCRGRCGYRGPIYYPPIVADAGALYGPRAIRQFLGVDGGAAAPAGAHRAPLEAAAAQAPDPPPKLSNPTTRARAWRFVEAGDRHFKQGDYRRAASMYRKAGDVADEIAEVHFRQGFALMAAGSYPAAVAAMRDGLQLKPTWPDSGFVLEELFPSAEAKREIFRQLHAHVDEHPHDADGQFCLAVLQHFDGQAEAAEVRFRRVVELTGRGEHARVFLPLAAAAEPDEEAEPENRGPLLP